MEFILRDGSGRMTFKYLIEVTDRRGNKEIAFDLKFMKRLDRLDDEPGL